MGKFFNQKLMNAKRIPHYSGIKDNAIEKMREEFNKSVDVKPPNWRAENLAKAREARKLKRNG